MQASELPATAGGDEEPEIKIDLAGRSFEWFEHRLAKHVAEITGQRNITRFALGEQTVFEFCDDTTQIATLLWIIWCGLVD